MSKQRKITIQSMCDTKTENVAQTIKQILALEKEGADLVRVAVPTKKAALALKQIKRRTHVPIVADIHFDPNLALLSIENGADKIRINPGNINDKDLLTKIAKAAKRKKIPIRIGVNSGSLETSLVDKHGGPTPKALVESAITWVKFFEKIPFKNLTISIKSADVEATIQANELLYQKLKRRKTPYPIHLGVTSAGPLLPGVTRNAIALGHLLRKGIGDTIRISLTADPIQEIKAAKELLKALGLYDKEPTLISCPTCGRTEVDLKVLVGELEKELAKVLPKIPAHKRNVKIAAMGCVVNGPGEAREADYAICGGKKLGAIYKKGKHVKTVPEKELIKELLKLIKKDAK